MEVSAGSTYYSVMTDCVVVVPPPLPSQSSQTTHNSVDFRYSGSELVMLYDYKVRQKKLPFTQISYSARQIFLKPPKKSYPHVITVSPAGPGP